MIEGSVSCYVYALDIFILAYGVNDTFVNINLWMFLEFSTEVKNKKFNLYFVKQDITMFTTENLGRKSKADQSWAASRCNCVFSN